MEKNLLLDFQSKKKLLTFLYLIILASFVYSSANAPVNVKFLTTAVEPNTEILFQWENAIQEDFDAKIVFFYKDIYPTEENHFIEGSYAYLNPRSEVISSHPAESGQVSIKAPAAAGLYKIFYCAKDIFGGFYCTVGKPILVLNCGKKTFNNNNKSNKYDKNSKSENIKRANSNIEHIIIILSENHSFDSIYGNYCKAPAFSNPQCNLGPECCEAIPADSNGVKPVILTDVQNSRWDPCHQNNCETSEINEFT